METNDEAYDMAGAELTPEKIKSPIQLMAAWFVMLVSLVSVLLTAAANIEDPTWAAGFLVISAAVVILIVIGCVVMMLTKFRPHLQEGEEYSQWLRDQNTYSPGIRIKKAKVVKVMSKKGKPRFQVSTSPGLNEIYHVGVAYAPGFDKLIESLKNAKFNAKAYAGIGDEQNVLQSLESSECIWIGSRVDPRAAIEAIEIATNHWPHLKYIQLSGDDSDPPDNIHDEIFFGGDTTVAKNQGLLEWSKKELVELKDSKTLKEFHSAIRRHYF
jgi:hypothetical protein